MWLFPFAGECAGDVVLEDESFTTFGAKSAARPSKILNKTFPRPVRKNVWHVRLRFAKMKLFLFRLIVNVFAVKWCATKCPVPCAEVTAKLTAITVCSAWRSSNLADRFRSPATATVNLQSRVNWTESRTKIWSEELPWLQLATEVMPLRVFVYFLATFFLFFITAKTYRTC